MNKGQERVIRSAKTIADDFDDIGNEPDEFDPNAPDEFTDEDAVELSKNMSEAERDAVNRSRRRGRAPHTERTGHKGTEARGRREHQDNDFTYRPTNSLDAPPARPGMEQRWVRVLVGDKNDVKNWAKQKKQHWTPRTLDTVPEDFNPPTQQVAGIGDVIMVGDLILCERDARYGASRRKFYRNVHQRQIAATKRHIEKVERADHKITVEDREDIPTTVGRGRRVRAQDD